MEDPPGFSGSKPSPFVPPRTTVKTAEIPSQSLQQQRTTPQQSPHSLLQNQNEKQQQQQQQRQPVSTKDLKEIEKKIEKLLTRLQRQFSAQRPSEQSQSQQQQQQQQSATITTTSFVVVPPRPPDQAAASLGRELADAFFQSFMYNNNNVTNHSSSSSSDNNGVSPWCLKVLASLKQRGIHPSIPHAFFAQLIATSQTTNTTSSDGDNAFLNWDEWLPSFILECEHTILEELPNMGGSAAEEAEISGLDYSM